MKLKYYLENTEDSVSSCAGEIVTKFGNIFIIDDGEIIKAFWKTPFDTLELNNPEFSKYYLESYSENMMREYGNRY